MSVYDIVVAAGDGVGQELLDAAILVLNTFTTFKFIYHNIHLGDDYRARTGSAYNECDMELYQKYKIMLKGPLTVPSDKSAYIINYNHKKYTSVNQLLRKQFELHTNIRPCQSYHHVNTSKFSDVDIVIFRQNTEDVYTGEEHMEDSNNTAIGIKRITRSASIAIATAAFDYAVKFNRKSVTAIHKANVCRLTDGLFIECCQQVSKQYPSIQYNEHLADSCMTKLMINHSSYDILLCPNLYGDLLSDLVAGMCGSLGLSGAAHIGAEYSLFEPTHGSAPDIAGENQVNPVSMLLCGSMMLAHLGEVDASHKLDQAIKTVIESGRNTTADLGGRATTQQMTQSIIDELQKLL